MDASLQNHWNYQVHHKFMVSGYSYLPNDADFGIKCDHSSTHSLKI